MKPDVKHSPTETHKAVQLRELQRRQRQATVWLVLCFAAMLGLKIFEGHYPAIIIGIFAAGAEAATIGGVADWFAIAALFGKPLPDPPFKHMDILRNNKSRIADNLSRFLENKFLSRDLIGARLRDINFVAEIVGQLSDTEKSRKIARLIARLLPKFLDAMPKKLLLEFAGNRLTAQLTKMDIAPFAVGILEDSTKGGRFQMMLDYGVRELHKYLHDKETLEDLRNKIQNEMPVVLRLFPIDKAIRHRLIRAMKTLLSEIKDDPDHPFRQQFEQYILNVLDRMRNSEDFARRVDKAFANIQAHPEFDGMAERVWDNLIEFSVKDVASENSVLVAGLADFFLDVSQNLKTDENLSADINACLVTVLGELVETHKRAFSDFVAGEMKRWDDDQFVSEIEANVGSDLQYIRMNGMFVGGIVGMILYGFMYILPF